MTTVTLPFRDIMSCIDLDLYASSSANFVAGAALSSIEAISACLAPCAGTARVAGESSAAVDFRYVMCVTKKCFHSIQTCTQTNGLIWSEEVRGSARHMGFLSFPDSSQPL